MMSPADVVLQLTTLYLLDTSQRPPQHDGSTYFSSGGARDHINAMGMPDDGTHYDYEDHLRSMGGGTFVAKVCIERCSSSAHAIQAPLHIVNVWRNRMLSQQETCLQYVLYCIRLPSHDCSCCLCCR
jgi:hypothetical protein